MIAVMRRTASPACHELIKRFEGFSATPYRCPAGKLTIGFGHVIKMTDRIVPPINQVRAIELLVDDLAPVEIYLTGVLPDIPQHQFDALASFAYNAGIGALDKSTLLKRVKAGDVAGAGAEFGKWTKARVNGVLTDLPGLVKRRAAEAALFLSTEIKTQRDGAGDKALARSAARVGRAVGTYKQED